MSNVSLNKQDETFLAKFDPVMEDRDLKDIDIHPDNTDDPNEGIQALAGAMEETGQGRPLICVPGKDNRPQIIDGARIFTAAKYLGWAGVTLVLLTNITAEEAVVLMASLKAHQRKKNYIQLAKRFKDVKAHAKKVCKEINAQDSNDSKTTTRQYMQKILGFENEKYVSDFETIIDSHRKDEILKDLDQGLITFNKAVRMATEGSPKAKTPDAKSYVKEEGHEVYMCTDCPRRKQFINKVDNDAVANSIDELEQ